MQTTKVVCASGRFHMSGVRDTISLEDRTKLKEVNSMYTDI